MDGWMVRTKDLMLGGRTCPCLVTMSQLSPSMYRHRCGADNRDMRYTDRCDIADFLMIRYYGPFFDDIVVQFAGGETPDPPLISWRGRRTLVLSVHESALCEYDVFHMNCVCMRVRM